MGMPEPSTFNQPHFQIRSGDTAGLNADTGWEQNEDIDATLATGTVFRIRFKITESAAGNNNNGFRLQVNRNTAGWVDAETYTATSGIGAAVSVISAIYNDGDATSTELLTNDGGSYVNGVGVSGDKDSNAVLITSQETEIEWCILIHGFHDSYTQNVVDNTLDFRVIEADGTAFTGSYNNPRVTLTEGVGFIGGNVIEGPKNIGPFVDGNGNLYTLIEASHTSGNVRPVMIKSTDDGDTWREMDGAGRPTEGDLEGVDMQQVGTTLHIIHQKGFDVFYHTFTTSDHGTTPDEWVVVDEAVATPTTAGDQSVGIAVLSDGRVRATYQETVSTDERVRMITRSSGGSWGSASNVDGTASTNFSASSMILGDSDLVHVFYVDQTNADVYHNSLSSGDSWSGRESCETDADLTFVSPISNAVRWNNGTNDRVMVLVKDASDNLAYSVVVSDDGSPGTRKAVSDNTVWDDAVGSSVPAMALAVDSATNVVYALYIDSASKDLFWDQANDDGGWTTDVEQLDTIDGEIVVGNVVTPGGGTKVLGFFYIDAHDTNDGGVTGWLRYGTYAVPVSGFEINESDSAAPGESASLATSAPQVSATDSATPGESTNLEQAYSVGESETITVVDIPRYYADGVFVGEAVSLEVVSPAVDLNVNESDSATPGESVSLTVSAPQISESDAISIGESANLEQAYSVGETDSATPADATTVTTSAPQIDETEAVAPAESINLEQAYSIAESDSASPGEAPDLTTSAPQIDEADAVSIGESVNLEHAYNVGEADSIVVGEADSVVTSDPQIDEADAVSAAESTNLELAHHVAVSDSAAVGEDNVSVVVGALQPRTISVSDSATPSDVATVANSSLPLSATDSAAPGETINLEQAHNVTEADSITLGESTSLEVGALQPQEISESDAISVGESASATVSAPQIDEADAVSIGESVSAATDALLISEAESVSLGESTNLELAYHASVSSAATASDSAPTAELTIEVIESETVSTADATTLAVGDPQVTATDAISVGELSSVDIPGFGDRNVSVSETVSLGESAGLEIIFEIVEVEDAAPGESVDAAIPGYVLLGSLNYTNVPFDDRRSAVEYEEDRASVPFEDHRSGA